jgi:hypothetical protein
MYKLYFKDKDTGIRTKEPTYKYTEFRKKYPNATAAEFCTQTDFIEK